MHVQILVYDGFDELDVLGPFEVLHAAAAAGAELRIELVRLASATVTSTRGLQLHVSGRLEPPPAPELLVLPGAGWLLDVADDVWSLEQRRKLSAAVAAVHGAGTSIAAVSSGVLLLAAAGIIEGRAVTTHAAATEELQAAGATVIRARVVDDGDLITSSGISSGLDLALWLVERYAGAAIAHAVERQFEHERRGTVWRRPG